MKAEHGSHARHDGLVSPRQILPVVGTGIRAQGRLEAEGEDEEPQGKDSGQKARRAEDSGDDPLTATLSGTVNAVGGKLLEMQGMEDELEQKVVEEKRTDRPAP